MNGNFFDQARSGHKGLILIDLERSRKMLFAEESMRTTGISLGDTLQEKWPLNRMREMVSFLPALC